MVLTLAESPLQLYYLLDIAYFCEASPEPLQPGHFKSSSEFAEIISKQNPSTLDPVLFHGCKVSYRIMHSFHFQVMLHCGTDSLAFDDFLNKYDLLKFVLSGSYLRRPIAHEVSELSFHNDHALDASPDQRPEGLFYSPATVSLLQF